MYGTSPQVFCASALEGVQINSCAGTCTSVRCEPTRVLCSVLLSSCLYEVLVWNQYACIFYAKQTVKRTNIEIFDN